MIVCRKEENFCKSYHAQTNDLSQELSLLWGVKIPFEGTYYDDYTELLDMQKTRRDKYTITNISENLEEIKQLQLLPDYLRWIESTELHYLPYLKLKHLDEGLWTSIPSLYLPTELMNMIFDSGVLSFDQSNEVLESIAFLCWLPVKEVKQYLSHLKETAEENLQKELSRKSLSNTKMYKSKKAELAKQCKDYNLDQSGTKLDLGLRLAKHLGIALETSDNGYNGDVTTIPTTTSQLRKLGIY